MSRALAADARHGASWCVAGLLDERARVARGATREPTRAGRARADALAVAQGGGDARRAERRLHDRARTSRKGSRRSRTTRRSTTRPPRSRRRSATSTRSPRSTKGARALRRERRPLPRRGRGAPMAPPPTEARSQARARASATAGAGVKGRHINAPSRATPPPPPPRPRPPEPATYRGRAIAHQGWRTAPTVAGCGGAGGRASTEGVCVHITNPIYLHSRDTWQRNDAQRSEAARLAPRPAAAARVPAASTDWTSGSIRTSGLVL